MMTKKIKVNGEIIKLTDMCRWEVRQGVLYNLNTKHDEGVEGDEVEYRIGDTKYRGHIVGYTCYQFIATKEWGQVVLSASQYNPIFTHNTKVEEVYE